MRRWTGWRTSASKKLQRLTPATAMEAMRITDMETTLITDPDRIAHIYNTYMKRDFPRNELKPLAAMRRRLQFYLDNGYRETDVAAQVFGVHYLVLEAPGGRAHSADEIREIYGSLYKSMLPPVMYQAFFKIKGQD